MRRSLLLILAMGCPSKDCKSPPDGTPSVDVEIVGEGSVAAKAADVDQTLDRFYLPIRTEHELTLTALPDEGWRFESWTGNPRCTSSAATVVVPALPSYSVLTCRATFVQADGLIVHVHGTGSGVVTVQDPNDPGAAIESCTTADGTCAYDVGDAARLELVAVPDQGSVLRSFTGAGASCATPDTCAVDVSSGGSTVTAIFDPAPPPDDRPDCVLDSTFLDLLQDIAPGSSWAPCDDASDAAQAPSLVPSGWTLPAQTGLALKYAAFYQGDLALSGRAATLGCAAPGVVCGNGNDTLLVDGPYVVAALQLNGAFESSGSDTVEVDVLLHGTRPELDVQFGGGEGASELLQVAAYPGGVAVQQLIGSSDYAYEWPTHAPHVLVDGDALLILMAREPGADPGEAYARALSQAIDELLYLWDPWAAPALEDPTSEILDLIP